jgi:diguanylate cyclase (GGDEF)-like protein/putative nucleotidyltransferase with HDIG domain
MRSMLRKKGARFYTDGLIALGAAAVGYSFFQLVQSPPGLHWVLLVLITSLLSMRVAIRIPSVKSEVTVYDTFIFISLFMHGAEAATLLAAVAGYGASVRCANTKRSYAVNIAITALSVFVAARVTRWVLGVPLPELAQQATLLGHFIFALGMVALLYYIINTVAIAVTIAVGTGEPIHTVWSEGFLWSSVSYFAGAFAAGLTVEAMNAAGLYGLVILVPMLLLTYFSYRKFFDKVESSNRHIRSLADLHLSTIEALALAIDAKDRVSRGHVRRVQIAALEIAREMGITDEALLEALKAAALLHDIGKLAVPDHILNKPGQLSKAEFAKVAVHPEIGARILSNIAFPYPVVPIVHHHHERWDGQGYPQKLAGEAIPLGARILAVADNYDALRVNRNSSSVTAPEQALQEIRARAGTLLDPQITAACCRAAERIEEQLSQVLIPRVELEDNARPEAQHARITKKLSLNDLGNSQLQAENDVYQNIADAQQEVLALYELSHTLATAPTLPNLLEILADRVRCVAHYDACAIFLADAQRDKVRVAHAVGHHRQELEGKFIAWGYGLSGWAAANTAPMSNARAYLDFPFLAQGAVPLMHATAIPLTYHGKALGVMTLYTAHHLYDDDELRLVEAFAHHAAVALNNLLTLQETRENAFTDGLTGLPNARYLNVLLEQQLEMSEVGHSLTLLMLDLDGFKLINDTYGHHLGDEMLRRVSTILRNNLRSSDTLVRYGGDEFIGVLDAASPQLVEQLILQLQKAVDSFELPVGHGKVAKVGVSIGQAIFPKDGRTIEELIVAADQRMYSNKRERKSRAACVSKVIEFPTGTNGF